MINQTLLSPKLWNFTIISFLCLAFQFIFLFQVEAERKKRALILESEGKKESEINIAEGKKQATILESEAEKTQLINSAAGAAQSVILAGEARAKSIAAVAEALGSEKGSAAASLAVAENYVTAFGELAKASNTLLLPANAGDVTGMVTQAMSIYKKLDQQVVQEVLESESEEKEPSNEWNDWQFDIFLACLNCPSLGNENTKPVIND